MLENLAAKLESRRWRERIEWTRKNWPSFSRPDIRFYEDDDCLIRYRKSGTGSAIVFLCDGPATLEVYDDLIDKLSNAFTVIIFETPANGFSIPKSSYNFEFAPTNDVVARFLKEVAGEGAILAFSCGGAYAAIDIAVRHPYLCKKLITIQAPSWHQEMEWKKRRDPKGIVSMPIIGQLLFPRMMKPRAPLWYQMSMADTPLVGHFCRCTQEAFDHGANFALPTLFQKYLTGEEAPFDQAEQPTLAIWGEQDESHVATDKESSRMLAKNVKLLTLKHVGHFPELEDTKGFATLASHFSEI